MQTGNPINNGAGSEYKAREGSGQEGDWPHCVSGLGKLRIVVAVGVRGYQNRGARRVGLTGPLTLIYCGGDAGCNLFLAGNRGSGCVFPTSKK